MALNRFVGWLLPLALLTASCGVAEPTVEAAAVQTTTTTTTTIVGQPIVEDDPGAEAAPEALPSTQMEPGELNEPLAETTNTHLGDHLQRSYGDRFDYFDTAAMACMTGLTEREDEPPSAVMDLIVLYCVPELYIDGWGESVVLPGAAGAEQCFARIVVEGAVSGSLADAAWFGIDRWDPPEPQRSAIMQTLESECGLSEAQWLDAGLAGPSAIELAPDADSRRRFCDDLFDVEYSARPLIDDDDAAAFLAESERQLAAFAAIEAPESLSEEFSAFLAAQQATVDVLRETGWTMKEYFDAGLTSEDVGLTTAQEAALGRFLDFNYGECYE